MAFSEIGAKLRKDLPLNVAEFGQMLELLEQKTSVRILFREGHHVLAADHTNEIILCETLISDFIKSTTTGEANDPDIGKGQKSGSQFKGKVQPADEDERVSIDFSLSVEGGSRKEDFPDKMPSLDTVTPCLVEHTQPKVASLQIRPIEKDLVKSPIGPIHLPSLASSSNSAHDDAFLIATKRVSSLDAGTDDKYHPCGSKLPPDDPDSNSKDSYKTGLAADEVSFSHSEQLSAHTDKQKPQPVLLQNNPTAADYVDGKGEGHDHDEPTRDTDDKNKPKRKSSMPPLILVSDEADSYHVQPKPAGEDTDTDADFSAGKSRGKLDGDNKSFPSPSDERNSQTGVEHKKGTPALGYPGSETDKSRASKEMLEDDGWTPARKNTSKPAVKAVQQQPKGKVHVENSQNATCMEAVSKSGPLPCDNESRHTTSSRFEPSTIAENKKPSLTREKYADAVVSEDNTLTVDCTIWMYINKSYRHKLEQSANRHRVGFKKSLTLGTDILSITVCGFGPKADVTTARLETAALVEEVMHSCYIEYYRNVPQMSKRIRKEAIETINIMYANVLAMDDPIDESCIQFVGEERKAREAKEEFRTLAGINGTHENRRRDRKIHPPQAAQKEWQSSDDSSHRPEYIPHKWGNHEGYQGRAASEEDFIDGFSSQLLPFAGHNRPNVDNEEDGGVSKSFTFPKKINTDHTTERPNETLTLKEPTLLETSPKSRPTERPDTTEEDEVTTPVITVSGETGSNGKNADVQPSGNHRLPIGTVKDSDAMNSTEETSSQAVHDGLNNPTQKVILQEEDQLVKTHKTTMEELQNAIQGIQMLSEEEDAQETTLADLNSMVEESQHTVQQKCADEDGIPFKGETTVERFPGGDQSSSAETPQKSLDDVIQHTDPSNLADKTLTADGLNTDGLNTEIDWNFLQNRGSSTSHLDGVTDLIDLTETTKSGSVEDDVIGSTLAVFPRPALEIPPAAELPQDVSLGISFPSPVIHAEPTPSLSQQLKNELSSLGDGSDTPASPSKETLDDRHPPNSKDIDGTEL